MVKQYQVFPRLGRQVEDTALFTFRRRPVSPVRRSKVDGIGERLQSQVWSHLALGDPKPFRFSPLSSGLMSIVLVSVHVCMLHVFDFACRNHLTTILESYCVSGTYRPIILRGVVHTTSKVVHSRPKSNFQLLSDQWETISFVGLFLAHEPYDIRKVWTTIHVWIILMITFLFLSTSGERTVACHPFVLVHRLCMHLMTIHLAL